MIAYASLPMGVNAQEQYLASIRRIEALAAALREQGHEPTDEMRIAYRTLVAGIKDESWECERPLILAVVLESIRPEPEASGE